MFRGEVWEGDVLLSNGKFSGEDCVVLPRKMFYFRAQNGEIWCILGAIFL